MGLPVVPLPTRWLEVGDEKVEVRGLSHSEVLALADYRGRGDDAENYLLALGAGCTVEEAAAWRAATHTEVAGPVVEAIMELSGLTPDAPKSGGAVDSSGGD